MRHSQSGKRYKNIYEMPGMDQLFRQGTRKIKPWYRVGRNRDESQLKYRQFVRNLDPELVPHWCR